MERRRIRRRETRTAVKELRRRQRLFKKHRSHVAGKRFLHHPGLADHLDGQARRLEKELVHKLIDNKRSTGKNNIRRNYSGICDKRRTRVSQQSQDNREGGDSRNA